MRLFPRLVMLIVLAGVPACQVFQKHQVEPTTEPIVQDVSTQFADLPRTTRPRGKPISNSPVIVQSVMPQPVEVPTAEAPIPKATLPNTPFGPKAVEMPADPPLVAAVRSFIQDRPDDALEHLRSLDKQSQDVLLQLIPAVVRASQVPLSQASSHEVGLLMRELQGPMHNLSQRSPLFVDKAVFCKSVKGFGRYDPLPERPTFKPGAYVGLYVEIGNVPSEPDAEGFATHLSCTLQVRDNNGVNVEITDKTSKKPVEALREAQREVTRSPVRDYFIASWFPVPTRPGSYTVSFEVRDVTSGRAVTKILPFKVQ